MLVFVTLGIFALYYRKKGRNIIVKILLFMELFPEYINDSIADVMAFMTLKEEKILFNHMLGPI